MFSKIWQTKKKFCDLKILKAVDLFPRGKEQIRVSFFSMVFCNTTTYFYAGQSYNKLCFISLKSIGIVKP